MSIATFNIELANVEMPNIGLNMAAVFFGAAAVTVCGVILRQVWMGTRGNPLGPYAHMGPPIVPAGPEAELSGPLRLMVLVAELKSNLAACQAPTADPLAMDEFQSSCDALVQLPYEAMEKTWAAYTEIMKINHYAEQVASFAGVMNDGSSRIRCIQAKSACRDRLTAAIDALEHNPLTSPSQLPTDIEPDLPMPSRTVGAILGANASLTHPV